jgi:hypothetical protein
VNYKSRRGQLLFLLTVTAGLEDGALLAGGRRDELPEPPVVDHAGGGGGERWDQGEVREEGVRVTRVRDES